MFCSFRLECRLLSVAIIAYAGCTRPSSVPERSPDGVEAYQAIITAALNAYVETQDSQSSPAYLVPRQTTTFSHEYDDVRNFASGWGEDLVTDDIKSALEDFVRAVKKPVPMPENPQFSFAFQLIAVEEETRLLEDRESIGWDQTFSNAPPSQGLLQISPPVIDSTRRFAIVYVVWTGGDAAADGSVLVLTKKDGRWLVEENIPLWMS